MRAHRRLEVVRDPDAVRPRGRKEPRRAAAKRAEAAALRVEADAIMAALGNPERPRTRGECADGLRPCPWIGCRHHLGADVGAGGTLKLTFPDLENPTEVEHSCSLDVADDGVITTLEDVAIIMNMSRERARQLEEDALERLRMNRVLREIALP